MAGINRPLALSYSQWVQRPEASRAPLWALQPTTYAMAWGCHCSQNSVGWLFRWVCEAGWAFTPPHNVLMLVHPEALDAYQYGCHCCCPSPRYVWAGGTWWFMLWDVRWSKTMRPPFILLCSSRNSRKIADDRWSQARLLSYATSG